MKGKQGSMKTQKEKESTRQFSSPEAQEEYLISLAINEAEKRLRNGTASSQLICHYLKLGSTREKLEQEKISRQNELLMAQTDAARSATTTEELYKDALNAFRSYRGTQDDSDEDEEY